MEEQQNGELMTDWLQIPNGKLAVCRRSEEALSSALGGGGCRAQSLTWAVTVK